MAVQEKTAVEAILADARLRELLSPGQLRELGPILGEHLGSLPARSPAEAGRQAASSVSNAVETPPPSAIESAKTQDGWLVFCTDGACSGNPDGPGGWACVLTSPAGEPLWSRSGGVDSTTNVRMELTACAEAFEAAPKGAKVRVLSDLEMISKTLVPDASGKVWKTKANHDLWNRIRSAAADRVMDVVWVRGHDGHKGNEKANDLAQAEAQRRRSLLRSAAREC